MNKPLIGAHVSYKKIDQLYGTISDLLTIGATSGAIYISPSRSYRKDFDIDLINVQRAHDLARLNNFNIENIIVHSPLVGNLANTDEDSDVWVRTLESYFLDLLRMEESGLKYYNFHPGSSEDTDEAIVKLSKSINALHDKTKGHNTVILLETMMTKGNYIGKNFEQLARIIDGVVDKSRIGVCMDTCHVWDGGYDIKNDLDGVLKEFDQVIGLGYLKALHINDSKNELGSGKDRHEAIGEGYIGKEALINIVNHKLLRDLPKALETPYGADDYRRWKDEIDLLIN